MNLTAPNGHVVELQINHSAMIEAKSNAHHLYEERSAILRTAESQKRKLTRLEKAKANDLLREQKRIYGAAWYRANNPEPTK